MVTKKNPESLNISNGSRPTNPPYPVSPSGPSNAAASQPGTFASGAQDSPNFDLIDMRSPQKPRRDSDVSSHGTWDTDDEDDKQEEAVEIPKPLRITPSKQNLSDKPKEQAQDIPAILKPGPSRPPIPAAVPIDSYASQALANPWADHTPALTPQVTGRSQSSNNPYLKPKLTGDTTYQPYSSPEHQRPAHSPPQPPAPPPTAPVELPADSTPSQGLSQLSLASDTTVPDASQGIPQTSTTQAIPRKPVSPVQTKGQSTLPTQATAATEAANPWQHPPSPTASQKWGDDDLYAPPSALPAAIDERLVDQFESPQTSIPPPISAPQPNNSQSYDRPPLSPATIERQRSEHYQIKHINWRDGNTGTSSVRQSPILTQNANGPCPLMALVNALVLTTPAHANTALVETLRTREQVSLGLLLDAVFDELMSGRRGDSAATLPDVSDLYSFLLALHTGMNVNPRFVPEASSGQTASMNGLRTGSSQQAGSFESTREMKLYSTFSIPLIHGWVPPRNTQAYQAFERRAQSFEDAQNIQFAESELEDKLQAEGLTGEEQQILQDIQTIKHFLTTWPTQLTDHGLQAISSTLQAGQIAILFRNDHFSTIYKEPRHGALMTLVTDAGYSSHDEIVWESLVDVNGAASELFSGDFRTVSHNQDVHLNQQSSAGGIEGWQTVPDRSRRNQQDNNLGNAQQANSAAPPPLPGPRPTNTASTTAAPSTEQEDHDFALALQLQEEEDAQQRQEQERRRQEQQLSEQFLSGQNEGRPPAIPPRRGGSRQSTSVRPAVNRPADTLDADAPPSYEQSSSDRPYREGNGQSAPLNAYNELRRQQEQQSAYAAQSSSPNVGPYGRSSYGNRMGRHTSQTGTMPGGYDGSNGRRPGQAATAQDAEERCVVM